MFSGGFGDSMEDAVIIQARTTKEGISAETQYIEHFCGQRNADWVKKLQGNASDDDKTYDVIQIELKNGSCREFWFDISSFYGKFF